MLLGLGERPVSRALFRPDLICLGVPCITHGFTSHKGSTSCGPHISTDSSLSLEEIVSNALHRFPHIESSALGCYAGCFAKQEHGWLWHIMFRGLFHTPASLSIGQWCLSQWERTFFLRGDHFWRLWFSCRYSEGINNTSREKVLQLLLTDMCRDSSDTIITFFFRAAKSTNILQFIINWFDRI